MKKELLRIMSVMLILAVPCQGITRAYPPEVSCLRPKSALERSVFEDAKSIAEVENILVGDRKISVTLKDANGTQRDILLTRTGDVSEPQNRARIEYVKKFISARLAEMRQMVQMPEDVLIRDILLDMGRCLDNLYLTAGSGENIGFTDGAMLLINEEIFHSDHLLPALFFIAALKRFSNTRALWNVLNIVFEENRREVIDLREAMVQVMARAGFERGLIGARIGSGFIRPFDDIMAFAAARRYFRDNPSEGDGFREFTAQGGIVWVDGLQMTHLPGWYNADRIYVNSEYDDPQSAIVELWRLRSKSLSEEGISEDEERDVLFDRVGLTNVEAGKEYRREVRNRRLLIGAGIVIGAAAVTGGAYQLGNMLSKYAAGPGTQVIQGHQVSPGVYEARSSRFVFVTDSDPFVVRGGRAGRHVPYHMFGYEDPENSGATLFTPSTETLMDVCSLKVDPRTGKVYIDVDEAGIMAVLSPNAAGEMFIVDAFPGLAKNGKLSGGQVKIVPQGKPTGKVITGEVILPPLKAGKAVQLPITLNCSVEPVYIPGPGIAIDERGMLVAPQGTSGGLKVTYRIQIRSKNSLIQFAPGSEDWVQKEFLTKSGRIKQDIEAARAAHPTDAEMLGTCVKLMNTYFAWQTRKMRILLPEGKTWMRYLGESTDEHGRLLCDCDVLATYAMIFLRDLGLRPECVVILTGYANRADFTRLTENEGHAVLGIKIGGQWILFDPTRYAPLALGDIAIDQRVEDLNKLLRDLRVGFEANRDTVRKIEDEINRLERERRAGQAAHEASSEGSAREYIAPPELAEQLDNSFLYAKGAGASFGLPVDMGSIQAPVPVSPGRPNKVVEQAESSGIKVVRPEIPPGQLQELLSMLAPRHSKEDRVAAIRTLSSYGIAARDSAPALIAMLDDPDDAIGYNAAHAIRRIQGGVPALTPENAGFYMRLTGYLYSRYVEIDKKGEFKKDIDRVGKPALQELIAIATTHKSRYLREFAVGALAHYPWNPDVLRALIDIAASTEGDSVYHRWKGMFSPWGMASSSFYRMTKQVGNKEMGETLKAACAEGEDMPLLVKSLGLFGPFKDSPAAELLGKLEYDRIGPELARIALDTNVSIEVRANIIVYIESRYYTDRTNEKLANDPYLKKIIAGLKERLPQAVAACRAARKPPEEAIRKITGDIRMLAMATPYYVDANGRISGFDVEAQRILIDALQGRPIGDELEWLSCAADAAHEFGGMGSGKGNKLMILYRLYNISPSDNASQSDILCKLVEHSSIGSFYMRFVLGRLYEMKGNLGDVERNMPHNDIRRRDVKEALEDIIIEEDTLGLHTKLKEEAKRILKRLMDLYPQLDKDAKKPPAATSQIQVLKPNIVPMDVSTGI
ncbi:MAG: HEAT repeat domain-containing protein [Candidatus Omnitrophica bacterium]|nr:HEAT repeat domain-containing protein [Candidatus Omnitrophota bacterium]